MKNLLDSEFMKDELVRKVQPEADAASSGKSGPFPATSSRLDSEFPALTAPIPRNIWKRQGSVIMDPLV